MDCSNKKQNEAQCPCDYARCARRGVCCECVAYHRENKELPACLRDGVNDHA